MVSSSPKSGGGDRGNGSSYRDFWLSFGIGASIASIGAIAWWAWTRKKNSGGSAPTSKAQQKRVEAATVLTREVAKLRNLPPASSLSLSNQLTNERLVYKLWMNRSFQLEPKDRDPLHAHVRGIMLNAFWDSAREDGDKRHNFDKVKVLLDEVVSRISDLTPNRNDLREQLAQAVDADHIVTMLSKGAFNAEEFVRTVVSVSARLLQLEAPAYNSNTRQWLSDFRATMLDTNNVDMWAALRSFIDFVHAKVDQIALGAANYRLTMLIPFVEQHGLDYLRAWIEGRVDRGEMSFRQTAAWAAVELSTDTGRALAP